MSVFRRFLVAPSLVRLLRKERGGSRITEGYFAPQAGRTSFVRVQGTNCFLVLVTGAEGASVEERTEVPRAHGDALLDVCAGKAVYERTAVALGGAEALVDRYVRPAGLDLVSLVFEDAEAARTFVPPVWFGAEVSADPAYEGQSIALTGVPAPGEIPLSNAALDAVLDLVEPRFGSGRPTFPPPKPPAPRDRAAPPPRPADPPPPAPEPAASDAPAAFAAAAAPIETKPEDQPKPEEPPPAAPVPPLPEPASAEAPPPEAPQADPPPAEPLPVAEPLKAEEVSAPIAPAAPPEEPKAEQTPAPGEPEPAPVIEPPKAEQAPAEPEPAKEAAPVPAKPEEAPKEAETKTSEPVPAAAAAVVVPESGDRLPPDARIDDVIESLSKALGAAIRNPQEPGGNDGVAEAFERWQVRPRRTQQT